MSEAFWDWAVAAYAAPGVADECLHLQDAHEQCVPLLLWAAWCADTGRAPDDDVLEAACDTARVWQDHAVAPLRALRRALKVRRPDMDDEARLSLREEVKAVELGAERRLMAALQALSPAPGGAAPDRLALMVAGARVWGEAVPRPALSHLSERLPA